MTSYRGTRTPAGCVVLVDGEPLDPRLDLVNHSPTGFSWGYSGSGPAQLALAILAHHFQDDCRVWAYYHVFKVQVISGLPHDDWEITSDEIEEFVAAYIPF